MNTGKLKESLNQILLLKENEKFFTDWKFQIQIYIDFS